MAPKAAPKAKVKVKVKKAAAPSAPSNMALLRQRMEAQKKEEERIEAEKEAERLRLEAIEKEEAAAKKKAEEDRKRKEADAAKKQKLVDAGKAQSKRQTEKLNKDREKIEAMRALAGHKVNLSDEKREQFEALAAKNKEREDKNMRLREERDKKEAYIRTRLEQQQEEKIRAPILCVLGHVDTGKTKLLDQIRKTNVQSGEAGGITQQIGASFFPIETIIMKTAVLEEEVSDLAFQIPGLLIIDTPGHESFTNLRSRGSGLCDIAILVIDIMHGLEAQTKESITLLRKRGTPFVVALNKIDRMFDWETHKEDSSRASLAKQPAHVQQEFQTRMLSVKDELMAEGLNSILYWENDNYKKNVSLVPTSAITGEGIPDLLFLMTSLTQQYLGTKISKKDELECTVLEVKVVEGFGHTIDVILVNGELHEGDTIMVGGTNGPIRTQIRALLTPHPLKELRVKSEYLHHKMVPAAQGVKISAQELEHAVAGSPLFIMDDDQDEDEIADMEAQVDISKLLAGFKTVDRGVYVQASTLGSLEALLSFLKDSKIPVAHINIGPIHKKHIIRASTMVEKQKEYAIVLAFDVNISKEAEDIANKEGVKIFKADIIYHLFDAFTAHMKEWNDKKREASAHIAIWPVEFKIVPKCVFNAKDPIVLGVEVVKGRLQTGTPVCTVVDGKLLNIGRVVSVEKDHKQVDFLKKGEQAAIKIEPAESTIAVGRHFQEDATIFSRITRESIDAIKDSFADQLTKDDKLLIQKLKKALQIV